MNSATAKFHSRIQNLSSFFKILNVFYTLEKYLNLLKIYFKIAFAIKNWLLSITLGFEFYLEI